MTPDPHAAAERLRKHETLRTEILAGNFALARESPYYILDSDEWNYAAREADMETLAQAYLAEHPADAVTFPLHVVMFGDKPILFTESLATAKGRIGVPVGSKQTSKDGLRIETVSVSVPKEPA